MTRSIRIRRQQGFSMVEALVSAALVLAVTAASLALVDRAQSTFQVEPEAADIQQRLRVAAGALSSDLLMAGAGSYSGSRTGPLTYYLAPVLPFRQGFRQSSTAGTFRSDTATLLYVPPTSAQTTTAQPVPEQSTDVIVTASPGCPIGDALCGFTGGMRALVYDDDGAYSEYTITDTQAPLLQLQHDLHDAPRVFKPGSTIVQVATRTYYIKNDPATSSYQLMRYDGGNSNDVPVVDHVVALQFDYYGEPQPPLMRQPLDATSGPWTTYGPKPPPPGAQTTAYPPGENCVFTTNGTMMPAPRLPQLAGGSALVRLTPGQLTDGPRCPDTVDPNRFDADLLRIRKIAVMLRVESAVDALRGPAGVLFTHAGTSRSGNRFVPDAEVRFDVSPRNLNLGR